MHPAGLEADVSWDNNWIHYLDAMLQLATVHHVEKRGELVVPVSFQEICIDPSTLLESSTPIGKIYSECCKV